MSFMIIFQFLNGFGNNLAYYIMEIQFFKENFQISTYTKLQLYKLIKMENLFPYAASHIQTKKRAPQ